MTGTIVNSDRNSAVPTGRALAAFVTVLAVIICTVEGIRWAMFGKVPTLGVLYMPVIAGNLWVAAPRADGARRAWTTPWAVAFTLYYSLFVAVGVVARDWLFLTIATLTLGAGLYRMYVDRRTRHPAKAS